MTATAKSNAKSNGHRKKWPVEIELVKGWEWTDVLTAVGGVDLQGALQGPRQVETMCAVAWVLARRDDPEAAWSDFRELSMADLDMTNAEESPPNPRGDDSGTTPPLSPAFGA